MGTAAEVQAKYEALKLWHDKVDSLPEASPPYGVASRAGLKSQLVKRMKQLFELRTGLLSKSSQEHAMALYRQMPNDYPACGSVWTPQGASCGAELDASLSMCQRLMDASLLTGAGNVTASVLKECASLAGQVGVLSSSCVSAEHYVNELRRINMDLLMRNMSVMPGLLGTQARVDALRDKLSYIDQWYAQGRAHLYASGLPHASLQADTSALLKAFWNGAYLDVQRQSAPSGCTTSSSSCFTDAAVAEAFRKKVLSDGLVADRQVLTAAFTRLPEGNTLPMTHAPLLMVMGDALRGLDERLKDVSRLHDLACRFKTCVSTPSRTSQLWALLANMDDGAELASLKSSATLVNAAWRETGDGSGNIIPGPFSAMSENHIAFQLAVKDALGLPSSAPYSGGLLTRASNEELSHSAPVLAALLRDAKTRVASYAVSGLFSPVNRRSLTTGLDRAKQDAIGALVGGRIQQLDDEIASYQSNRLTLVNGLLAQMNNQQSQDGVIDRLLVLTKQMEELSKDLYGVRTSRAVDEARYGEFMKGFEALVPAIQSSGQQMVKSEVSLSVSAAADTRHVINGGDDVRNMRVLQGGNPFFVTAVEGETLSVEVSGQWAPTCALSQVLLPSGQPLVVNDTSGPIMTGPEGYSTVLADSVYKAASNTTVTSNGQFENWNRNVSACAGLGLEIPIVKDVFKFTASLTGCAQYEVGTTWSRTHSDSTADGRETRSTYSFSRGIRSAHAPFPDQPVGALLLVQMPPDQAGGIEHTARGDAYTVRVVQAPYTSVFVEKPSKFYLVVNDVVGCPGISSTPLSLRVVQMQSKAAASRDMAKAMLATQTALQPQAEAYVAQGRLLANQAAHLRNSAYQKLFEACSVGREDPESPGVMLPPCQDLNYYPESLRNLFETWISKEIVGVEREVELVQLERRMRSLLLEVSSIERDFENTEENARMLALVPAWTLRNLDGRQLRIKLNDLDQLMGDVLAPVLDVLYPEVLEALTAHEWSELDDLTDLDPLSTEVDMPAMALEAKQAAQAVTNRWHTERSLKPVPSLYEVFISIPRPDWQMSTTWTQVGTDEAQRIWNNILAGRDFTLDVKPEHIYQRGQLYIDCVNPAPVIDAMGMYMIDGMSGAVTHPPYGVSTHFLPRMLFPTTRGVLEYDFADNAYLAPGIVAHFGPDVLMYEKMHGELSSSAAFPGRGVSLFSTIHLNLMGMRNAYPNVPHPDPQRAANGEEVISPLNPLASTSELIIALRLEAKSDASDPRLPGVPQCE
ncbi:hypothetical protein ACLEPN_14970 [Myxococcus sp. 1LA]